MAEDREIWAFEVDFDIKSGELGTLDSAAARAESLSKKVSEAIASAEEAARKIGGHIDGIDTVAEKANKSRDNLVTAAANLGRTMTQQKEGVETNAKFLSSQIKKISKDQGKKIAKRVVKQVKAALQNLSVSDLTLEVAGSVGQLNTAARDIMTTSNTLVKTAAEIKEAAKQFQMAGSTLPSEIPVRVVGGGTASTARVASAGAETVQPNIKELQASLTRLQSSISSLRALGQEPGPQTLQREKQLKEQIGAASKQVSKSVPPKSQPTQKTVSNDGKGEPASVNRLVQGRVNTSALTFDLAVGGSQQKAARNRVAREASAALSSGKFNELEVKDADLPSKGRVDTYGRSAIAQVKRSLNAAEKLFFTIHELTHAQRISIGNDLQKSANSGRSAQSVAQNEVATDLISLSKTADFIQRGSKLSPIKAFAERYKLSESRTAKLREGIVAGGTDEESVRKTLAKILRGEEIRDASGKKVLSKASSQAIADQITKQMVKNGEATVEALAKEGRTIPGKIKPKIDRVIDDIENYKTPTPGDYTGGGRTVDLAVDSPPFVEGGERRAGEIIRRALQRASERNNNNLIIDETIDDPQALATDALLLQRGAPLTNEANTRPSPEYSAIAIAAERASTLKDEILNEANADFKKLVELFTRIGKTNAERLSEAEVSRLFITSSREKVGGPEGAGEVEQDFRTTFAKERGQDVTQQQVSPSKRVALSPEVQRAIINSVNALSPDVGGGRARPIERRRRLGTDAGTGERIYSAPDFSTGVLGEVTSDTDVKRLLSELTPFQEKKALKEILNRIKNYTKQNSRNIAGQSKTETVRSAATNEGVFNEIVKGTEQGRNAVQINSDALISEDDVRNAVRVSKERGLSPKSVASVVNKLGSGASFSEVERRLQAEDALSSYGNFLSSGNKEQVAFLRENIDKLSGRDGYSNVGLRSEQGFFSSAIDSGLTRNGRPLADTEEDFQFAKAIFSMEEFRETVKKARVLSQGIADDFNQTSRTIDLAVDPSSSAQGRATENREFFLSGRESNALAKVRRLRSESTDDSEKSKYDDYIEYALKKGEVRARVAEARGFFDDKDISGVFSGQVFSEKDRGQRLKLQDKLVGDIDRQIKKAGDGSYDKGFDYVARNRELDAYNLREALKSLQGRSSQGIGFDNLDTSVGLLQGQLSEASGLSAKQKSLRNSVITQASSASRLSSEQIPSRELRAVGAFSSGDILSILPKGKATEAVSEVVSGISREIAQDISESGRFEAEAPIPANSFKLGFEARKETLGEREKKLKERLQEQESVRSQIESRTLELEAELREIEETGGDDSQFNRVDKLLTRAEESLESKNAQIKKTQQELESITNEIRTIEIIANKFDADTAKSAAGLGSLDIRGSKKSSDAIKQIDKSIASLTARQKEIQSIDLSKSQESIVKSANELGIFVPNADRFQELQAEDKDLSSRLENIDNGNLPFDQEQIDGISDKERKELIAKERARISERREEIAKESKKISTETKDFVARQGKIAGFRRTKLEEAKSLIQSADEKGLDKSLFGGEEGLKSQVDNLKNSADEDRKIIRELQEEDKKLSERYAELLRKRPRQEKQKEALKKEKDSIVRRRANIEKALTTRTNSALKKERAVGLGSSILRTEIDATSVFDVDPIIDQAVSESEGEISSFSSAFNEGSVPYQQTKEYKDSIKNLKDGIARARQTLGGIVGNEALSVRNVIDALEATEGTLRSIGFTRGANVTGGIASAFRLVSGEKLEPERERLVEGLFRDPSILGLGGEQQSYFTREEKALVDEIFKQQFNIPESAPFTNFNPTVGGASIVDDPTKQVTEEYLPQVQAAKRAFTEQEALAGNLRELPRVQKRISEIPRVQNPQSLLGRIEKTGLIDVGGDIRGQASELQKSLSQEENNVQKLTPQLGEVADKKQEKLLKASIRRSKKRAKEIREVLELVEKYNLSIEKQSLKLKESSLKKSISQNRKVISQALSQVTNPNVLSAVAQERGTNLYKTLGTFKAQGLNIDTGLQTFEASPETQTKGEIKRAKEEAEKTDEQRQKEGAEKLKRKEERKAAKAARKAKEEAEAAEAARRAAQGESSSFQQAFSEEQSSFSEAFSSAQSQGSSSFSEEFSAAAATNVPKTQSGGAGGDEPPKPPPPAASAAGDDDDRTPRIPQEIMLEGSGAAMAADTKALEAAIEVAQDILSKAAAGLGKKIDDNTEVVTKLITAIIKKTEEKASTPEAKAVTGTPASAIKKAQDKVVVPNLVREATREAYAAVGADNEELRKIIRGRVGSDTPQNVIDEAVKREQGLKRNQTPPPTNKSLGKLALIAERDEALSEEEKIAKIEKEGAVSRVAAVKLLQEARLDIAYKAEQSVLKTERDVASRRAKDAARAADKNKKDAEAAEAAEKQFQLDIATAKERGGIKRDPGSIKIVDETRALEDELIRARKQFDNLNDITRALTTVLAESTDANARAQAQRTLEFLQENRDIQTKGDFKGVFASPETLSLFKEGFDSKIGGRGFVSRLGSSAPGQNENESDLAYADRLLSILSSITTTSERRDKVEQRIAKTLDQEGKSFAEIRKNLTTEQAIRGLALMKREINDIIKLSNSQQLFAQQPGRRSDFIRSLNAAQQAAQAAAEQERKVNSLVKGVANRVILYGGISFALYGVIQRIRQAIDVMVEFESSIVATTKVMNPLIANVQLISKEARTLGKDFGFSLTEVTEAMTVFAQQGKSASAVVDLAKASLLAANTTTLSTVEATEALTAALKQFQIEDKRAIEVLDAWNEVENRTAITSKALADAIKQAGTSARLAGISFDELNGIIAGVGSATRQTGNELGRAFRFILSRLRTDDSVNAIQSLGIAMFNANGQFRDAFPVLQELATRWDGLSDAQRTSTALTVAGARRYNSLLVLMDQWDQVINNTVNSIDSQNSSLKENERVLNTTEKRIQRFQSGLQGIITEIGDAGGLAIIDSIVSKLDGAASLFSSFPDFAKSIIASSAAVLGGVSLIAQGIQATGLDNLAYNREIFSESNKTVKKTLSSVKRQVAGSDINILRLSSSQAKQVRQQITSQLDAIAETSASALVDKGIVQVDRASKEYQRLVADQRAAAEKAFRADGKLLARIGEFGGSGGGGVLGAVTGGFNRFNDVVAKNRLYVLGAATALKVIAQTLSDDLSPTGKSGLGDTLNVTSELAFNYALIGTTITATTRESKTLGKAIEGVNDKTKRFFKISQRGVAGLAGAISALILSGASISDLLKNAFGTDENNLRLLQLEEERLKTIEKSLQTYQRLVAEQDKFKTVSPIDLQNLKQAEDVLQRLIPGITVFDGGTSTSIDRDAVNAITADREGRERLTLQSRERQALLNVNSRPTGFLSGVVDRLPFVNRDSQFENINQETIKQVAELEDIEAKRTQIQEELNSLKSDDVELTKKLNEEASRANTEYNRIKDNIIGLEAESNKLLQSASAFAQQSGTEILKNIRGLELTDLVDNKGFSDEARQLFERIAEVQGRSVSNVAKEFVFDARTQSAFRGLTFEQAPGADAAFEKLGKQFFLIEDLTKRAEDGLRSYKLQILDIIDEQGKLATGTTSVIPLVLPSGLNETQINAEALKQLKAQTDLNVAGLSDFFLRLSKLSDTEIKIPLGSFKKFQSAASTVFQTVQTNYQLLVENLAEPITLGRISNFEIAGSLEEARRQLALTTQEAQNFSDSIGELPPGLNNFLETVVDSKVGIQELGNSLNFLGELARNNTNTFGELLGASLVYTASLDGQKSSILKLGAEYFKAVTQTDEYRKSLGDVGGEIEGLEENFVRIGGKINEIFKLAGRDGLTVNQIITSVPKEEGFQKLQDEISTALAIIGKNERNNLKKLSKEVEGSAQRISGVYQSLRQQSQAIQPLALREAIVRDGRITEEALEGIQRQVLESEAGINKFAEQASARFSALSNVLSARVDSIRERIKALGRDLEEARLAGDTEGARAIEIEIDESGNLLKDLELLNNRTEQFIQTLDRLANQSLNTTKRLSNLLKNLQEFGQQEAKSLGSISLSGGDAAIFENLLALQAQRTALAEEEVRRQEDVNRLRNELDNAKEEERLLINAELNQLEKDRLAIQERQEALIKEQATAQRRITEEIRNRIRTQNRLNAEFEVAKLLRIDVLTAQKKLSESNIDAGREALTRYVQIANSDISKNVPQELKRAVEDAARGFRDSIKEVRRQSDGNRSRASASALERVVASRIDAELRAGTSVDAILSDPTIKQVVRNSSFLQDFIDRKQEEVQNEGLIEANKSLESSLNELTLAITKFALFAGEDETSRGARSQLFSVISPLANSLNRAGILKPLFNTLNSLGLEVPQLDVGSAKYFSTADGRIPGARSQGRLAVVHGQERVLSAKEVDEMSRAGIPGFAKGSGRKKVKIPMTVEEHQLATVEHMFKSKKTSPERKKALEAELPELREKVRIQKAEYETLQKMLPDRSPSDIRELQAFTKSMRSDGISQDEIYKLIKKSAGQSAQQAFRTEKFEAEKATSSQSSFMEAFAADDAPSSQEAGRQSAAKKAAKAAKIGNQESLTPLIGPYTEEAVDKALKGKTGDQARRLLKQARESVRTSALQIEGVEEFGTMVGRPVVKMKVNGVPVTFYQSSGLAPKEGVAPGKWYPISGIDPKTGWFNKSGASVGGGIKNYYGSPDLKKAAEMLDANTGDLRGIAPTLIQEIGGKEVSLQEFSERLSAKEAGTKQSGIYRTSLKEMIAEVEANRSTKKERTQRRLEDEKNLKVKIGREGRSKTIITNGKESFEFTTAENSNKFTSNTSGRVYDNAQQAFHAEKAAQQKAQQAAQQKAQQKAQPASAQKSASSTLTQRFISGQPGLVTISQGKDSFNLQYKEGAARPYRTGAPGGNYKTARAAFDARKKIIDDLQKAEIDEQNATEEFLKRQNAKIENETLARNAQSRLQEFLPSGIPSGPTEEGAGIKGFADGSGIGKKRSELQAVVQRISSIQDNLRQQSEAINLESIDDQIIAKASEMYRQGAPPSEVSALLGIDETAYRTFNNAVVDQLKKGDAELATQRSIMMGIDGVKEFGTTHGTPVAKLDINGTDVTFFQPSVESPKKGVTPGKWYPISGIDPKTAWFNNSDSIGGGIGNYYGSSALKQAAEILDKTTGDIRGGATAGPYIGGREVSLEEFSEALNSKKSGSPQSGIYRTSIKEMIEGVEKPGKIKSANRASLSQNEIKDILRKNGISTQRMNKTAALEALARLEAKGPIPEVERAILKKRGITGSAADILQRPAPEVPVDRPISKPLPSEVGVNAARETLAKTTGRTTPGGIQVISDSDLRKLQESSVRKVSGYEVRGRGGTLIRPTVSTGVNAQVQPINPSSTVVESTQRKIDRLYKQNLAKQALAEADAASPDIPEIGNKRLLFSGVLTATDIAFAYAQLKSGFERRARAKDVENDPRFANQERNLSVANTDIIQGAARAGQAVALGVGEFKPSRGLGALGIGSSFASIGTEVKRIAQGDGDAFGSSFGIGLDLANAYASLAQTKGGQKAAKAAFAKILGPKAMAAVQKAAAIPGVAKSGGALRLGLAAELVSGGGQLAGAGLGAVGADRVGEAIQFGSKALSPTNSIKLLGQQIYQTAGITESARKSRRERVDSTLALQEYLGGNVDEFGIANATSIKDIPAFYSTTFADSLGLGDKIRNDLQKEEAKQIGADKFLQEILPTLRKVGPSNFELQNLINSVGLDGDAEEISKLLGRRNQNLISSMSREGYGEFSNELRRAYGADNKKDKEKYINSAKSLFRIYAKKTEALNEGDIEIRRVQIQNQRKRQAERDAYLRELEEKAKKQRELEAEAPAVPNKPEPKADKPKPADVPVLPATPEKPKPPQLPSKPEKPKPPQLPATPSQEEQLQPPPVVRTGTGIDRYKGKILVDKNGNIFWKDNGQYLKGRELAYAKNVISAYRSKAAPKPPKRPTGILAESYGDGGRGKSDAQLRAEASARINLANLVTEKEKELTRNETGGRRYPDRNAAIESQRKARDNRIAQYNARFSQRNRLISIRDYNSEFSGRNRFGSINDYNSEFSGRNRFGSINDYNADIKGRFRIGSNGRIPGGRNTEFPSILHGDEMVLSAPQADFLERLAGRQSQQAPTTTDFVRASSSEMAPAVDTFSSAVSEFSAIIEGIRGVNSAQTTTQQVSGTVQHEGDVVVTLDDSVTAMFEELRGLILDANAQTQNLQVGGLINRPTVRG